MIKLRVYCKSMGKMGDVAIINYMSGTVTAEIEGRGYLLQEPDYILMQSTGLLDVNGKEIFEGDVVKLRYFISSNYEFFKVTRFRGGSWRIDNRRGGTELWVRNEDCKVVGNVYQNPEFLEEVNNVDD